MNEVGLKPRWDQAPSALPLITESRTTGDQPRQRWPLVIGLFLLIAAVLVVPTLLIVHAFHGLGGTSAAAAQPKSSTSAPSAAAAPSERAAATALASLLGQSVTDRDTIVNAVGAVNQCTSGLSQAPKAFTDGATGRQKLLQQLAHLPGRSTLPAAMLQELTGAWQASATVDTDLGQWAQDEVDPRLPPERPQRRQFRRVERPGRPGQQRQEGVRGAVEPDRGQVRPDPLLDQPALTAAARAG